MGENKKAIGIDLGGTNLRFALFDYSGKILKRKEVRTPRKKEEIVKLIYEICNDFKKEFNDIVGCGIGLAGIIDKINGVLTISPNIPELNGFKIREEFKILPFPFIFENDANCAAVGEQWLGSARGKRNVLFITLGTGVGGGLILDGKLWSGTHGGASEFGHITVEKDGVKCGCGSRGCLEQYASAQAIHRWVKEGLEKGIKTSLREEKEITCEKVYLHAKAGDKFAKEVWERFGRYLGIGISIVLNLLDLEQIIIGGKISRAHEFFWESMVKEINERVFYLMRKDLEITISSLEDDAGLFGAAKLTFDNFAF